LYLLNQIDYIGEEAIKRLKVAAVWLMTAVGIPQIWMGDEWAEDKILGKIFIKFEQIFCYSDFLGDENRTNKVNKIDWSSLSKTSERSLFDLYRKLIAFRKSSSAIKSNNIHFFHQDSDKHILAYDRSSNETNELVVVIFNFSTNDQLAYCVTNWPKTGRWQEVISQVEIQIDKKELEIDLKSYEYKIFLVKA
jgi:1,4-alpha-glucan branching enzyme